MLPTLIFQIIYLFGISGTKKIKISCTYLNAKSIKKIYDWLLREALVTKSNIQGFRIRIYVVIITQEKTSTKLNLKLHKVEHMCCYVCVFELVVFVLETYMNK